MVDGNKRGVRFESINIHDEETSERLRELLNRKDHYDALCLILEDLRDGTSTADLCDRLVLERTMEIVQTRRQAIADTVCEIGRG